MLKKATERVFTPCGLLLLLVVLATEARAGGVVNVHIYVAQGSVWDSQQGQQQILQDKIQAAGIWRSVGVDLKFLPNKPLSNPNKALTEDDIRNYASTLKASARNVVVVYTNNTYKGGRAYTSEALQRANTPVIVVAGESLTDPPTNGYPPRDLAHELGHILLRDAGHVYYEPGKPKADQIFGDNPATLNLMNQSKNLGTELNEDQKKRAREYPCPSGVTSCPEISMSPGGRSTAVIKEVNQVAAQSSPTNVGSLTPQVVRATVKPNYRSQQSLTGLRAFTAIHAQTRKQAVNKQITFVCGTGERVMSYDEEVVAKVSIGDKTIGSMITYDVPIGAQNLKVVLQPPPNEKYGWIVKEIKFFDMSDLSRSGTQTFTPNAPEANVTLRLSERYGTNVSRLEITVDQCGGPSGGGGVKVVRNCTENEIEARRDMQLCEGDKCRTNSNSRAAVNFLSPNGSVFATATIPQSSEVEIGGFDAGNVSGAVLALNNGEVESQVNN
ncbi:MAG: hypothetical protein H0W99_06495 [Acidobacteria bacterium]|nr:hypothetical protein [Acidobacteriota bacterium]